MVTNTRATRSSKNTSTTSDQRNNVSKTSTTTKKGSAAKRKSRQKKSTHEETSDTDHGSDFVANPDSTADATANNQTFDSNHHKDGNQDATIKTPPVFRSRFPGLEMDTFEDSLDEWSIVSLRQAIFNQASTSSRAHSDVQALVKTIRLEYEKRMLMAALMGGVPEAVIWNIVGEGSMKKRVNRWLRFLAFCKLALDEKLPAFPTKKDWVERNKSVADTWKGLNQDEKTVFEDPYFFALAKLPDLSKPAEDSTVDTTDLDEEDLTLQHLDSSTSASKVHQLSDADKVKYQPIFDRLVDVEKVQLCYGQPQPATSVATIQKKSYAELRKAHQDFSVVCQRYQITYYLAAVSCGSTEGWVQVFSNNIPFAKWARETAKVPSKFETYIHGKSVSQEIEGTKVRQPSDERKIRLGHLLNGMVDAVYKGNIFPKVPDPEKELLNRGWPIRIVQKEGSLLSKDALKVGHRLITSTDIKLWLQDIENGLFVIESIPEEERPKAPKKQSSKKKKKSTPADSQDDSENEDMPTRTQSQNRRRNKKKTIVLSDSHDSEEEPEDHTQPRKKIRHHRSGSGSDSSSRPPTEKRVKTQRARHEIDIATSGPGNPPNPQLDTAQLGRQSLNEDDLDGLPMGDDI